MKERSTKLHERARKEFLVRVISCPFVDRLAVPIEKALTNGRLSQ